MADGKVVIETDLDSSGIEKGLKSLGSITAKGLKAVTASIAGTATALGGVAAAAVKVGSDFEAQMSRVKAISGATGEEFDKLKEQAIQLGADTAFSSTQAAEGMENLAAAGFTTSEIMEAMPGLLDLAAASGEDLAASSDIAASTLRGFGLEASEAGHVADVLAENANRTNSSVADTGEAMKYVAPLARAAGISMEETAAAIGIMANAGIQGSQAGTTLRGALSRLSKPTTDMQQAMDELGIAFYDSEGKMLSLADQVDMLQTAMEGMTDEQKNNYLVTLYGQEALSGMLALINEGSGSLASLTASYETCDGSAKTAAATMQDNLKGAIEQLGGSAESLGIVFYEDVSDSLKHAAQTATDSVNEITEAFNSGGLEAAVDAAGDEFADLAAEAASHAPEMVDAAVDFIESFASGVISNKGKLLDAAGDVAETLAGGLARLLPKELQEPVEEAVDAIFDSLSSGGLKNAGKTVVNTIDNVIDVVGKLADVALPPLTKALDFAGENLELVAASAAAAFTAFKGYKVVTSTSKAMASLTATVKLLSAAEKANALQVLAASGALTTKELVIGVLTGKITLATAAQTAWNAVMAANPIGLVITAVGALTAAIGVAALATDKASKSQGGLTEKQKETIEASKEAIKSIEEEAAARQKNINASTAEIDNAEALWNELNRIVDANGQVKAGYEARAEYITGELSDALGTEISMTDGAIDNYGELQDSIYDVIAAKKAEAVLDSMESDYTAAMQEQAEKAAALATEYEKLNSIKAEQAELEAALAEEAENATVTMTHTGDAVTVYSDKYYELKKSLNEVNADLETQQTVFDEANTAMQDNQKIISDYNMVAEAAMSGSTEKINSALATIQSGLDATLATGSAAAIEQANTTASTLTGILEGEAKGLYALQEETKNSLAETMGMALNQVGTGSEEMKQVLSQAGKEGSAEIVAAMAQAKISGTLSAEAEAGMESFIAGFDGLDSETQEVWAQDWYGALEGLEGFEELADPAEEGVDEFLESLRTALEVHSPSQAVKDIFSQVWPGAREGLSEGQESLNTTGNTVIQSFLATLGNSGILQGAKTIGSNLIGFFNGGMSSQKGNTDSTSKEIADSANAQLGSSDTQSTGDRKAREYNAGIGNLKGTIDATAKGIADSSNDQLGAADTRSTGSCKSSEYNAGLRSNSGTINATGNSLSSEADSGMGSSDTRSTGKRKGQEYSEGVGSQYQGSKSEGQRLGEGAKSGAGEADSYSVGSDFGSGFVGGIGSWISSAAEKAAELASSAYNAAKRWLDEHSPSRKTREIGKFFSQGLALGIEDEEKTVEREAKNITQTALNSLDMSAVSDKMRESMSLNTGRIAKSFALQSSTNLFYQSKYGDADPIHLSDEDISRLAKEFGIIAGKTVSENVGKMTMKVYDREFARVVKEAGRS